MNQRSHFTMTCLFALGTLFPVVVLRAAVPNQSVENLQKNATHIVVGKVTKIGHDTTTSGNYEETKYVAEISVTSVEKGEGIIVNEVIKVRYGQRKWIGAGSPPPGSNGHRGLPKKDGTNRVYLKKVKGRGYDVEFPNGFESIKPDEK